MADDDLIRRGDALKAAKLAAPNAAPMDAIAALPAVTAPQGVDVLKKADREILRLKAALWAIGHPAGIETKRDLQDAAIAALAPAEAGGVEACPCGSDVTDMDGHTVHDDDCPEGWQAQATIRKSQTVAPAYVDVLVKAAREVALREAAEACAGIRQRIANGPMPEGARFDYEQAILALIGEART